MAKAEHTDTGNLLIPGITRDGVVVPRGDTSLPDGLHVSILVSRSDITPELQAEWEQWDKAGDEAWTMIDQLETEQP